MPELPEVETTMRALAARLTGRPITALEQRRPDLRFPLPRAARRAPGRAPARWASAGAPSTSWPTLDDGQTLLLHLGMSGRLLLDGPPAGPHEHLTFGFDDGSALRFVDPRRFGMLDLAPTARARARIRGWPASASSRSMRASTGAALARGARPAAGARSRSR